MRQIRNEHLSFLEEVKQVFAEDPFRETHRNDQEDLIALRYGIDRDCILIFELGDRVALFAQQIEPARLKQKVWDPQKERFSNDKRINDNKC